MAPEYKISLRVEADSLPNIIKIVDQIKILAKPSELSLKTSRKVANEEKRKLFENKGIARIFKWQKIDSIVKPLYLSDESKKLTLAQIAKELGITTYQLQISIRRLKDSGEIENIRKYTARNFSIKQELKKIIEENPDKYRTLQEYVDKLGNKVSCEYVRQLLKKFDKEGLVFVSFRNYRNQQNLDKLVQAAAKKERRQEIVDEVKKLILTGKSITEVEEILGEKSKGIIRVNTVINMLRNRGEIPRQREIRRDKNELMAADNIIKQLYNDGLSYLEISKITGLDKYRIYNHIIRLTRRGEIVRTRKRGKTKTN